ncbi:uncharacterized protein TNIN_206621 [Trichonephila inaurata madagascariensis]|uniref:Uncharacterized protein n=1 Tax=Trichonephila inaurata madagascariensis TaxID=2747483 RepID=A0A8X6XM18_9ARAC|nr:uncharacterized protein TNIN_206621 [Trichonephila inaurata madagascariensis]
MRAKYIVLKDGELHIRNAARGDSFKKYRCLIKNILTGSVTPSVSAGQLIVTELIFLLPSIPMVANNRNCNVKKEANPTKTYVLVRGYLRRAGSTPKISFDSTEPYDVDLIEKKNDINIFFFFLLFCG